MSTTTSTAKVLSHACWNVLACVVAFGVVLNIAPAGRREGAWGQSGAKLMGAICAGWTQIPGEEMNMAGGGLREIVISGSRVEFVVNNGEGDWCDPPSCNTAFPSEEFCQVPGK